jgi:hypothetical protein
MSRPDCYRRVRPTVLRVRRHADGRAGRVGVLTFMPAWSRRTSAGTRSSPRRQAMAPTISPKKSWENSLAPGRRDDHQAPTVSLLLGGQWWEGALTGALLVVSATLGDLVRVAGQARPRDPDMGRLLPATAASWIASTRCCPGRRVSFRARRARPVPVTRALAHRPPRRAPATSPARTSGTGRRLRWENSAQDVHGLGVALRSVPWQNRDELDVGWRRFRRPAGAAR